MIDWKIFLIIGSFIAMIYLTHIIDDPGMRDRSYYDRDLAYEEFTPIRIDLAKYGNPSEIKERIIKETRDEIDKIKCASENIMRSYGVKKDDNL